MPTTENSPETVIWNRDLLMRRTEKRFDCHGLTLAADVIGNPAEEGVILLHGGGQTRASWGTALESVAGEGFYVVSLDLRGHGDSDWAQNGDYHLDAFVADLRAVIASLQRAPFVVGASLGGLAGLLLAGEHPDSVNGLILVDIVPRVVTEGANRILDFMTARPDGFASIQEAADEVAKFLPHRPRPTDMSGLSRNLRVRDDGRYRWHWDVATLSGEHVRNPSTMIPRMEAAARKLRTPTLLLRGARSDVVDEEGARAFQCLAPHAEVVSVAHADHMVAGDRNDSFNTAVLQFLNRYRSR